jgi:hypothetical protein
MLRVGGRSEPFMRITRRSSWILAVTSNFSPASGNEVSISSRLCSFENVIILQAGGDEQLIEQATFAKFIAFE